MDPVATRAMVLNKLIAQAQTECSKHEKKLSSIAYFLLVNRAMIPSKDGFVEEEGSKEPETRPIA